MRCKRRDILGLLAAGGATLTLPAFLAGCGVTAATRPAATVPENPFLQWFALDEAALRRVLAELSALGGERGEVYFQHRRSALVKMQDGEVTGAETRISQGAGLRVVAEGRVGFAATAELTLPALIAAAREAAAAARGAGPSAAAAERFAHAHAGLHEVAVPWSEVGAGRKQALLERATEIAREADPAVATVSAQLADVDERILIATLDGRLLSESRPLTRLSMQVTAEKRGRARSGFASLSGRRGIDWYSDERIDGVAQEAVTRALVLFDARPAPAGELPVVLAAGASGVLLHEAVGHAFEADFIAEGTSPWAGMLGQRVAAPFVTVVDQGSLPHERGALGRDDEGAECTRTALVEDGVLRAYLHDGQSAARHEVAPTGSARRESWRHPPLPRMTCTFMERGPHTREEIVASVERGILAEAFTGGEVTLGEGSFRFRVTNGWLIEKGKVTAPLAGAWLSGNGPEMLGNIDMVAADRELDPGGWTCGKKGQRVPVSHGMPTVRVSRLAVEA